MSSSQSIEYLHHHHHHQTLPPNRHFNGINCHFTHHHHHHNSFFSIPPPPPKSKFKSVSANLNQNPTLQSSSSYHKNTSTQQFHLQSSYSSLIQDCISSNSFERGKSIHLQMLADNGFTPDTYLQTKILMLYARAGGLSDLNIARKLFDEMPERNSTSWNTMILAYARFDDHKEVLDMFFGMLNEGISPDKFTFPSVVRAFIALEDCDGFREVHSLIIKFGLNRNLVVGGSLVDGFVSLGGSIDDAATAFDEMDEKNVISWNALLRGYVKEARWEEGWRMFYKMLKLGESPDHFTFATAIRVCGSLRSLDRGKQVHAKLIVFGYADDVFVGNSLIDMYAKCKDLKCCLKVFDQMREKNQVTWNSMISGEVQFGHFSEALMLFSKMQMLGYEIDRFNLTSALAACSGLADEETGQELHAYLVRHLLDSDVILGSALVDMYSKCGCVEKAHQAFERLAERNEMSWNSLLFGYVQMGLLEEAIEIYHDLRLSKNVRPDLFTFTSLLNLFAHHGNIDQRKQIHAHIIRTVGTDHLAVETGLVHMYAKCGSLNYAQDIFNQMAERNSYSWNSLIEGYEQNEHPEKSLQLFRQMQLVGIKPDCFSLTSALSACSSLSNIKKGKELHGFIVRNGLERQGILGCVLVDMYAKCKFLDCAYKIYSRTNEKDVGIQNVMVSAFVGCGKIEDAMQVFDQMEERNTISWNSILFGCANSESKGETFKLFGRMQKENIEFDCLSLVILFNLCASLSALAQGEQLHVLAIKRSLLNTSVIMDSALVDMYSKCGSIEQARKVFDKMKVKNVISWNAMINGYAKHGFSEDVLVLYELMQKEGFCPNSVTFLSVLSACSHTGRIEEGLRIFISMLEDHRVEAKAEHYTCMVDLLGRVGRLDEAKEVIERMPVKPEVSTWGALLGACRIHENVELGKIAADRLFDMDPRNPGHYVLMSNIYARAGKWKEVEEVRNLMKSRGVTKDPGTSWIEINNEIQTFRAGAQYHPRTKEIYTTLRCLSLQMKGLGYIPDTKFVLQNVDEVEEEEYLMQHSERLAMALGLISLPRRSIIRVFKNLRICGDCHTAAKFISKITSRKIIIRDTNRFHHFENGMCSCGDFW